MCHLNVLMRKTANHAPKVLNFMNVVTSVSFTSNDDGDGVWARKMLIKSLNKINLFKYPRLAERRLILAHQRSATSGLSFRYTQPFSSKEGLVFMHNGVMSQFTEGEASDSYGMFMKIIREVLNGSQSRHENIVNAIKTVFKNQDGSYSIFIYDKYDKMLYYFKNNLTNMNVYRSDNFLYLTTSYENKKFLNILTEKFTEENLKSYIIYAIDLNLNIKEVGEIEHTEETQSVFPFMKKSIVDVELRECVFCQSLTTNVVRTGRVICDLCLKEMHDEQVEDNYLKLKQI